MIRFILVCIVVIAYLVLTIPVLLVEWIIGKFSPMTKDISSLRMVQAIFKFILWITGAKVTVIGEENVPKDQAVLYIGNHRSYFDIIITYARCPRLTGYIAKKDMEKVPLLRTWMRRLHCLFIDRENVKEALKTILAGIDNVKNGISMCIFPEGTRNEASDDTLLLPFKEGSLKMAEKTGYPIIPMSINNTRNIFEAHRPFIRSAHVVLEYGEPIYPKDLPKEQKKFLGAHCQEIIQNTISKNQSLV